MLDEHEPPSGYEYPHGLGAGRCGIGDRAIGQGRDDGVDGFVCEIQRLDVPASYLAAREPVIGDALLCVREHARGQVDPGHLGHVVRTAEDSARYRLRSRGRDPTRARWPTGVDFRVDVAPRIRSACRIAVLSHRRPRRCGRCRVEPRMSSIRWRETTLGDSGSIVL